MKPVIVSLSLLAVVAMSAACGEMADEAGSARQDRAGQKQAGAAGDLPATRTEPFKVFSALMYQHRPRPSKDDVKLDKLRMAYDVSLFRDRKNKTEPDIETVRKTAFKFSDKIPVCLDIEHWHVHGKKEETDRNLTKLIDVVKAVRAEKPNVKLGYYSVLPHHNYWASIKAAGSSDHQRWLKVNKRLTRLAEHVDFVFPSLYAFYDHPERWETHAIRHIREARQYGKPVYVFLWPQYHHGGQYKTAPTPFIETDYWRRQLEVCYQHADGVVLWGGWDAAKREKMTWDPDAAWWKETEAFIRRIRAEESKRGIESD